MNREKEIFEQALDLTSAPERIAFLKGAAAGDAALLERLLALLKATETALDFLPGEPRAAAPIPSDFPPPGEEAIGSYIGHYKLLQKVGEGGCGAVYMAEQEQPVRRRVALKVIKLGMDTRSVVARFEAERQALAMMDHPNIARVLDAGSTDRGRPFFVMELVRGIRITDYCDQNQLSTEARLKLFIAVCQAVQHAHQKGIIHRDLKPSNILVTLHDGVPVPKVIDFGIAKAIEQRLTDKTLFTELNQFLGTPAYMSPEQAEMSGLDIDTRSDIYSLGVLLYEILTGRTPFEVRDLIKEGLDSIRRTIREVEPHRPSTRLSTMAHADLDTVAKARGTGAVQLCSQLRGDLDWIVMKALEKDRTRRYETANGLAADLKRHLDNEPVVARPPSTAYRFQKAWQRNRLAFTAATAIAATLVIGIAASVWQARRALAAEQRAVTALDELRSTAPAFAEQARALAAREQFSEAIAKLDYAIKLRPDAAEYLVAKGDLFQCQLQLSPAAAAYREALRVQPGLARAEASARLCDELLAAKPNADGRLSRESLAKLHLALQQQQRPAAQLLPVARLLGEEKKLLLDYWLGRLKDLPVSPENPLARRLTLRDDGRLALDLGGTKLNDLSPLSGAPIASLDVSRCRELTDISPLHGLELVELDLSGTGVTDLAPLRGMRTLLTLDVSGSKVTDLTALDSLPLENLDLTGTRIFDLSALRGMKLRKLRLRDTRISDLSPIAGMPLGHVDASNIPALDYSPLAGAPLEVCTIQNSPVRDLSFLAGSSVRELCLFGCNELRGYSVLTGLKSLDLLILPQSYRNLPEDELTAIAALRTHPTLRNIQTEYRSGGGWIINTTLSKDVFWKDWDREQSFVQPLRSNGIQFSLQKLPAGTYSLTFAYQPLRDLSMLKGAPITALYLDACPVADLTPIRDLKLEILGISSDTISNLEPLRGMPLKTLALLASKVTDLSPLKGLPLRDLYVENCRGVTDVAALAEIPTLERLAVPVQARNVDTLRRLPRLQMLAFNRDANGLPVSTAGEFWKDYQWISRLREVGHQPGTLKRLSDGTWDVNLDNSPISDLAVLGGASISRLSLSHTRVADLSPLRGMPIQQLWLFDTKVTDLGPLQGMPIEVLNLGGTRVSDISALRGMPLVELSFLTCKEAIDLTPLAGVATLRSLTLPEHPKNIEALRSMPALKRLSHGQDPEHGYRPDKTTAEFWKEHDARKPAEAKAP